MAQFENLAQFADELKAKGVDVDYEIVFAEGRYLEGLDIGEEFFPLWELCDPANDEALSRLDFDAILARRPANYSVAAPVH